MSSMLAEAISCLHVNDVWACLVRVRKEFNDFWQLKARAVSYARHIQFVQDK